eukprot:CAMPEP_0170577424 /NCGR_PEP_ID=MMETSP0224-20130122/4920_1 /TAXON_ID=285029 /ORGANISM="Togula jolla, Strain CCCM 725" /LENGTH=556 /DNA_ID=CAMNT_0010900335 /DNA_START=1 /DNA_END=1669 /DNA_ORIENTATION=-
MFVPSTLLAFSIFAATTDGVAGAAIVRPRAWSKPLRPIGEAAPPKNLTRLDPGDAVEAPVELREGASMSGASMPEITGISPAAYWGIMGSFPLVLFGTVATACLAMVDPRRRRPSSGLPVAKALETMSAGAVALVVSTIDAIIAPTLPSFGGGQSTVTLLFVEPIVAVSAAVLLPLILCRGPHRGRVAAAIGLLLLSLSCILLASSDSLEAALVARAVAGAANALVLTSVIFVVTVEALVEGSGWRLVAAIYGVAMGGTLAPWLGARMVRTLGLAGGMVFLSAAAATASILHVAVAMAQATHDSDLAFAGSVASRHLGKFSAGSVFRAAADFFGQWRHFSLLCCLSMAAASLSLHSMVLPLQLDKLPGSSTPEGAAGLLMGLTILLCSLAPQLFRETGAARLLAIALVVAALGFRALADGLASAHPLLSSVGLVSSSAGLGAVLGLAAPLLPALLRAGAASGDVLAPAAVVSASITVALRLGAAFGVGTQLALYTALGYKQTILVFATGLVLVAASAMFLPKEFEKDNEQGKVDGRPCMKAQSITHTAEARLDTDS